MNLGRYTIQASDGKIASAGAMLRRKLKGTGYAPAEQAVGITSSWPG